MRVEGPFSIPPSNPANLPASAGGVAGNWSTKDIGVNGVGFAVVPYLRSLFKGLQSTGGLGGFVPGNQSTMTGGGPPNPMWPGYYPLAAFVRGDGQHGSDRYIDILGPDPIVLKHGVSRIALQSDPYYAAGQSSFNAKPGAGSLSNPFTTPQGWLVFCFDTMEEVLRFDATTHRKRALQIQTVAWNYGATAAAVQALSYNAGVPVAGASNLRVIASVANYAGLGPNNNFFSGGNLFLWGLDPVTNQWSELFQFGPIAVPNLTTALGGQISFSDIPIGVGWGRIFAEIRNGAFTQAGGGSAADSNFDITMQAM